MPKKETTEKAVRDLLPSGDLFGVVDELNDVNVPNQGNRGDNT